MSVNPISYQEIQAFNSLYKLELLDWEIDAIKSLDSVALTHFSKQQEEQSKKNNKKK